MLNVFLVDDEYFVRTSLRKNIPWEENGFKVIGEANNGKTALEEIGRLRPDIAIVDINMPIYNGLELISLLEKSRQKCRYIILTGYDEFTYAQQAIKSGVYDYILKPLDYSLLLNTLNELKADILSASSLHRQLSDLEIENKELLLSQYYNDLVNCNLSSHGAIYYDDAVIKNETFIPQYQSYTIIIINLKPPILLEAFSKILSCFQLCSYICCQDTKKRMFLILDSSNLNNIHTFIGELHNKLKQLHLSPCIGIGKQYKSFDQLYLSYNEAQVALKNHSILKQSILYFDELDIAFDYVKIDLKTHHRLKACILSRNIDGAKQLLTQIYDDFVSSGYLFQALIFSGVELIHILIDVLSNQISMPVSVLNTSENILDILNNMNDIEDIKNWTIDIYAAAIRNFLSYTTAYSNVTLKVENFIQENYHNPELTIPMLSEKLFLNYSYLCSCFKRDKHITINDYLNKLRIEKAVELFQGGIDNVAYVSEKTGFNNSGYFSKRFKKAVGLTPSEYMKTLV